MKPIYPFSDMQVGEVRGITSPRKLAAVRSAAHMHAKKREAKGEARPKFKVERIGFVEFRIERTA